MTRQELFDTVAKHLLKQNEKAVAVRENNFNVSDIAISVCMYLDDRGRKCAIGCLIPDGHPAQHERMSVDELVDAYPDLLNTWGIQTTKEWPDPISDLIELQQIHDGQPPFRWREKLAQWAQWYDLSTEVCDVAP